MKGRCKPHQLVRKNELTRSGTSPFSYERFICETCGFGVWLRVEDVKNAEL